MNLDIETTVRTIFVMLLAGGVALFLLAVRAFREAGRLRFFLKKRALLGRAWQFVFFALLVVVVAFLINGFAEPVAYQFFLPSPTATLTPTVTATPTITLTPTITSTGTITPTMEFTPTPEMPAVISEGFVSQVTPNPEAVFSNLSFARRITGENLPVDAAETFSNPIEVLNGTFSYDRMTFGSQWTALWFREGELICWETQPWNGASGGYGYTDCSNPSDGWLPGDYEVQIFVGQTWKASGTFSVTGQPPTPTVTPTQTPTVSPTTSPTTTPTVSPTITPTRTITPTATGTIAPSATLVPSATTTSTPQPTRTSTPTRTATPTRTPTWTPVPSATLVPTATRRSTIYR